MPVNQLLALSHDLGREDRALAILGEGNTSARVGNDRFWVKASGSNLATLTRPGLTECRTAGLLALLDARTASDEAVEAALLDARVDPNARKPSVEAVFHAWLLSLPNVNFVGHTHPISVNSVLCSRYAARFASSRLFPDEIVCCGESSVYVRYTDPGRKLAQAIRRETNAYVQRHGAVPRLILLGNHGLIALGATPGAALAATLMADKAARILLGAAQVGGPRFLSASQVRRIAGRADEHHRRKVLGL